MAVRRLTFRPATVEDAADLAPRLREADRAEIEALGGGTSYGALYGSVVTATEAYSALLDGRVEAMFGVRGTLLGRSAVIWALGSDHLTANPFRLIRGVRRFVDDWGDRYGMLTNVIDSRNHASMKMLHGLGFTLGSRRPIPGGEAITFWRYPRVS